MKKWIIAIGCFVLLGFFVIYRLDNMDTSFFPKMFKLYPEIILPFKYPEGAHVGYRNVFNPFVTESHHANQLYMCRDKEIFARDEYGDIIIENRDVEGGDMYLDESIVYTEKRDYYKK